MGTFNGFNRTFEAKSLEMKAAQLPEYHGNLKDFQVHEWKNSQPDWQSRTFTSRDFVIRQSVDECWHDLEIRGEFRVPESRLGLSSQSPMDSRPSVPTGNLPSQPGLTGEELKKVINRGSEAGRVTLGRGFATKELGK